MQQQFTIKNSWKLFTVVVSMAMIAGIGYFTFDALKTGRQAGFWIVICAGTLAMFTYCILWAINSVITLTLDTITKKSVFRTQTIILKEIKGVRFTSKYVLIENLSGKKTQLDDLSYFNDNGLIQARLHGFRNLDTADIQASFKNVLHDKALGETATARKKNLKAMKTRSTYLNYAGIGVAVWLWFYPRPFEVVFSAAVLFIVLAAIYLFRHQNVMDINSDDRKTAYPNVFSALIYPSAGILICGFIQFDLLKFTDCLPYALALITVLGVLCAALYLRDASKDKWGNFIVVMVAVITFSIGSVIDVNCAFDHSPSKNYPATVLAMHYTSGKHSTYYLTLNNYGPLGGRDEIEVPRYVYNEVQINGRVNIYLKKGVLNIPWYFIDL